MSLLGLDIGISGCKVVAFGLDGQALAQAYREYRLYQPQPGWMELDPAEVWQAVTEVIGRVTAAVPGDPVRALSVSTHGVDDAFGAGVVQVAGGFVGQQYRRVMDKGAA